MRRISTNKSSFIDIVLLLALVLTASVLNTSRVREVADGPWLPPAPWENLQVADGPWLPPAPWENVLLADGPWLPPAPWENVSIA